MRGTATLACLAALLAAGCGTGASGDTVPAGQCGLPTVVVTTSVLGDVVANLVGEEGRVEVLMPVGADPHSFQVSAGQAASLRRATLVVVNGLGLEEGMGDAIDAAAAEGAVVVEAASFVEPLPLGEGGDHGSLDPHIWGDPRRMADVVSGLGEALAGADPACPERWREAAARYRAEVLVVDAEIEALLESVPPERRKLVTNHHSLGYFADRYGFEVLGAIIPGGDTLAAPSPADLAALVEVLEREGVAAIFAETTRPSDLAASLAAEAGEWVSVVALYTGSLGEAGSGAETYLAMQRTNAELIAASLGSP